MDKLFQPFRQIDISHKKHHEGTGLGLHLAKKLANLLGGGISVNSEFGKGSEFTLTLYKICRQKPFHSHSSA